MQAHECPVKTMTFTGDGIFMLSGDEQVCNTTLHLCNPSQLMHPVHIITFQHAWTRCELFPSHRGLPWLCQSFWPSEQTFADGAVDYSYVLHVTNIHQNCIAGSCVSGF